jgi:hypothetical protein
MLDGGYGGGILEEAGRGLLEMTAFFGKIDYF